VNDGVVRVFPANGVRYVSAGKGTNLAVPVPCVDLKLEGRRMRYYPVASTQFDNQDRAYSVSVHLRRYLVQDVDAGHELPLMARSPADAHAIARLYAEAASGHHTGRLAVDPSDPASVTGWTLQVAARNPGMFDVLNEWLFQPSRHTHNDPSRA
jgi:hypothetical protein